MVKFYAVTVGTEPGVYDNWLVSSSSHCHIKTSKLMGTSFDVTTCRRPEASWKVRGVEHPVYQGFSTREEAERVFRAALEREEVMAVPSASDRSRKKREITKPSANEEMTHLSPVSSEASLLLTPDTRPKKILSTTRRGIPSPPPSPTHRLHRMLRESSISTAPSSPLTEVTGHVSLQLDDLPLHHAGRNIHRITFDSDSPLLSWFNHAKESPFSLMGNRGNDRMSEHKSHSKAASSQDTSEEDEWIPRTKSTRNRTAASRGVVYRAFDDILFAKNIDPRIWLPNPPEFDPTKVKARPETKPASLSATSFKTPANSLKAGYDANYTQSPSVRMDRGRPSQLTPSLSLPVLPSCGVETNVTFSITPSSSPSLRLRNASGTGERGAKMCERSRSDDLLAEQPLGYCHTTSPRRTQSTSHIQVVRRDDGSRSSTFRVYCPPGCLHEPCIMTSPISDIAETASPKYVDAAVSPVLFVTSRTACNSPRGASGDGPPRVKTSNDLNACASFGLAQGSHVPHQGHLPSEADVRSPIAKGTHVPLSATR